MAQQMADPFRSAILNIPDESPVYEIRLGYWEPIERDNLSGRVALAGDSAHPMTLRKSITCRPFSQRA